MNKQTEGVVKVPVNPPRLILGMNSKNSSERRVITSDSQNSVVLQTNTNSSRPAVINEQTHYGYQQFWSYGSYQPSYPPPGLITLPSATNIPNSMHVLCPQYDSKLLPNLSTGFLRPTEQASGSYYITQYAPASGNKIREPQETVTEILTPKQQLETTIKQSHSKANLNHQNFNFKNIDSSKESIITNNYEYDRPDVPLINNDNDNYEEDNLAELTKIAMKGCEVAEKVAHAHRTRPCFKKIDSLCARMKQDLIRPDGVLANINSQGIVWAVKDCIFIFTRIINAWIITKGYVYNTPEGLSKVKTSMSQEFSESFKKWEVSTMDFINNLIRSFISLDLLVQNQRVSFQKNENKSEDNFNCKKGFDPQIVFKSDENNKTDDFLDTFTSDSKSDIKNVEATTYLSAIVEDSEETQRKSSETGTYFKTGIYNPPKLNINAEKKNAEPLIKTSEPLTLLNKSVFSTSVPSKNFKQITNNKIEDCNEFMKKCSKHQCATDSKLDFSYQGHGDGPTELNNDSKFNENDHQEMKKGTLEINDEIKGKVPHLLQRICSLNESAYFFSTQFMNNYFPDFNLIIPNFIDLRSILLRAEVGNYKNINEIVHDLRQMIFSGKIYLQSKPENLYMKNILVVEKELDILLANTYNRKNISE